MSKPVVTIDSTETRARRIARGFFPHQVEGVAFLLGRRRALFADDMGLGKTRQAIVALRMHASEGPYLVVCPASVKHNWAREIALALEGDDVLVVAPEAGTGRVVAPATGNRVERSSSTHEDPITGNGGADRERDAVVRCGVRARARVARGRAERPEGPALAHRRQLEAGRILRADADTGGDVICNCPGFEYRGACSHARQLKTGLAKGAVAPTFQEVA